MRRLLFAALALLAAGLSAVADAPPDGAPPRVFQIDWDHSEYVVNDADPMIYGVKAEFTRNGPTHDWPNEDTMVVSVVFKGPVNTPYKVEVWVVKDGDIEVPVGWYLIAEANGTTNGGGAGLNFGVGNAYPTYYALTHPTSGWVVQVVLKDAAGTVVDTTPHFWADKP